MAGCEAVCMARLSAPSPEVSNSRKMSMTSPGLRPRERRSSCILRTTWMASFSDHTWLGVGVGLGLGAGLELGLASPSTPG